MNQSHWPFVTTVTDVTNVSTSEQLALILETYCSFLPRLLLVTLKIKSSLVLRHLRSNVQPSQKRS